MLVQRLRRWPNIKTVLRERLLLAGVRVFVSENAVNQSLS